MLLDGIVYRQLCLFVCNQVDDNVGLLMSELKKAGLWGRINVIITSDHGMAQCSAERLIRLDDCLHSYNYTVVDLSPVAAIIPHGGKSGQHELGCDTGDICD